ncbi:MAG: hypothetical protein V4670_00935 [Bacteroidota bacterium]
MITTILAAVSASTGYGASDSLKGGVNFTTFFDWFSNTEKYIHVKGLIILDLIPIIFLIIQAVIFFKDSKKIKGLFTVLALFANIVGVFIAIQYANPIASQIAGWTPDNIPTDWIKIKEEWFRHIGLYSLTGVLGWFCFVITFFVSETKNTEIKSLPRFLNFIKNAFLFFLTFVLGMGAASLYEYYFLSYPNEISGATFIEMHRPIDLVMRKVGPIMFTFIVSLKIILATLFFVEKSKNKGWLIIAALIFLLCDTYIALTYNRPLNDLFLSWTPSTIPINWALLRHEWLNYHLYRNIFKTLGIISILLIYFFKKNTNTPQKL